MNTSKPLTRPSRPKRKPVEAPKQNRRQVVLAHQRRTFGTKLLSLCLPLAGMVRLWYHYGVKWPIWVYLFWSIIAIVVYRKDRVAAPRGEWRVPERTLHMTELAGGWPGALLAQYIFQHKTSKVSYQFEFWIIVLVHEVLWGWYLVFLV